MSTEATPLDVTQFNDTPVIRSLTAKQTDTTTLVQQPDAFEVKPKSKRGRKLEYFTDEERINARRLQQKQYRQRRNKELAELHALKHQLDNEQ